MLSYSWTHRVESGENQVYQSDDDYRGPSATVNGSLFWPLASRVSFGVGGSLYGVATRSEGRFTQGGSVTHGTGHERRVSGSLDLTVLGTLLSRPGTTTRCWSELTGSLSGNADDLENPLAAAPYAGGRGRSTAVKIGFILALRGRWGIARFGISYEHGLSSFYESR